MDGPSPGAFRPDARSAPLSWGASWGAVLLGLVGFAYAPLLRSGFLGRDYRAVLGDHPSGPLAGAWDAVSLWAWGLPRPMATAWAWHLESVLLLVGCAGMVALVLPRMLEPWLGPEPARGAAYSAAALLPLHPLAATAVAEAGSRGTIAGAFLGLVAAACFLRGRQEEEEGWVLASFPVLLVAAFSSRVALPMAGLLALAELVAVRRQRRLRLRLRTAATTGALFAAAALLPRLLIEGVFPLPPSSGRSADVGLPRSWLEALGELALPRSGLGTVGVVLAGALLLLALRPAARAARHAPRLWGGLLVFWAVCLALAFGAHAAPPSAILASVVWVSGVGMALGAARPSRRRVQLLVLVVGFAALTHGALRPRPEASALEGALGLALRALDPPARARLLVLDPPGIEGVPAGSEALGWWLHPRIGAAEETGASPDSFDPARVRGLTTEAFLALVSSDAFAGMRSTDELRVAHASPDGDGLEQLVLGAPTSRPSEPLVFRSLAFAPPSSLDPLDWEQAVLVADLACQPGEIERLQWVASDEGTTSVEGRVEERGGRRVASFDLASRIRWRLAGPVRSLVVEQGVRGIERGELRARLPEVAGLSGPARSAEDWSFACPPLEAPEVGGRFELRLLALDDLELVVLPVATTSGALVVSGAERFVRAHAGSDAPVCWLLDYRVGPDVLFRARGSVF